MSAQRTLLSSFFLSLDEGHYSHPSVIWTKIKSSFGERLFGCFLDLMRRLTLFFSNGNHFELEHASMLFVILQKGNIGGWYESDPVGHGIRHRTCSGKLYNVPNGSASDKSKSVIPTYNCLTIYQRPLVACLSRPIKISNWSLLMTIAMMERRFHSAPIQDHRISIINLGSRGTTSKKPGIEKAEGEFIAF